MDKGSKAPEGSRSSITKVKKSTKSSSIAAHIDNPSTASDTKASSQQHRNTPQDPTSLHVINEIGDSAQTWVSTETQYSWGGDVGDQTEAEGDEYQLQQWAYETSNAKMTFAERLEKSNWTAETVERL